MNDLNTIQSTINYIQKELNGIYSLRESESISYLLLENVLNYTRTQIHLNKTGCISDESFTLIKTYLEELKLNKPIQYVLGITDFYEMQFKVNRHTLIPRPETEELVHAIINENQKSHLKVLDIGTGSGCIPIALAKYMHKADVSSVDISAKAISIAKINAELNDVKTRFLNRDFLKWKNFDWNDYDLIVSNPPYVTEAEKDKMEQNVLVYEPHTALFVSDNDPLIFYRTIADFALAHLNPGGKLYLEINESLGKETKKLLQQKAFTNIELRKDINGKDRMIKAKK